MIEVTLRRYWFQETARGEVYIRRSISDEERDEVGDVGDWAAVHIGIGEGRILVINEGGESYVDDRWEWDHNPREWEKLA